MLAEQVAGRCDLLLAGVLSDTFEARGVVSRKKQLLPLILARLE